MKLSAEEVVKILNLSPLEEEGGMFRETYVSEEKYGERPVGTAIYYLLTEHSFSHLHRLTADEVYHFYYGDPVELTYITPDGKCMEIVLGQAIEAGQQVQHVVPKHCWQGSRLKKGGRFALLGTTMSPGYLQNDYEHADTEKLIQTYPEHKEAIERLTGELRYL